MERENYYLLLDLPLDPPEKDASVIEQAIRIKQSQWSRLRNHPTRALEAKQRISMLSDIRAVMLDPARRAQEAQAGIALIRKKEKEKFGRIDRHIGMYLSKGPVTDEEVSKLTILHGFSEADVRKRIHFLESKHFTISDYLARNQKIVKTLPDNEKITDIHKNLLIRMVKGYITAYEIEKLSIFYNHPASEIRTLVTVPIWENNKKGPVDSFAMLDGSIEKNISTNLKIVGNFSLYEFLDVIPSTALSAIQSRAQQKRKETQATGAKSAEVTAAGALAGYSITLFRSEEERKAYDMALARRILSTFHADISMAVIHNQIRSEYVKVLLRFAMDYALDEDDAIRFIEDFCRQHGWKVKSGQKNRQRMLIGAGVVVGILLFTLGTIWIVKAISYSRMKTDYNLLLTQTARMTRLEDKRRLLQHYVETNDSRSGFTQDALAKMKGIDQQIQEQRAAEDRFYGDAIAKAQALENETNLEEAQEQVRGYLKQYPSGRYAGEARNYLAVLAESMEALDFQSLQSIPDNDVMARVQAYKAFLTKYDKSDRLRDVQAMLDTLGVEYGKKRLAELGAEEARRDWDACIRMCREYLHDFPDGELSPKFSGLLMFYEEQKKLGQP